MSFLWLPRYTRHFEGERPHGAEKAEKRICPCGSEPVLS